MSFDTIGWCRFPLDPDLLRWIKAAHPIARDLSQDPKQREAWLRCGGTWFAGVNCLPNDAAGAVGEVSLKGAAIDEVSRRFGPQQWDRAQVSVIYPGYPQPMEGESPAAFRFRRDRDAAHVDGLLPIGPSRARHLHEPHGFVLGLPLTQTSSGAGPMVVWEGSHLKMKAAFQARLAGIPGDQWSEVDLTETYQATRRGCFESCRRVEIVAQPGEAYLIHRLALHGVAPWRSDAKAPPEGRMIAYFRPELAEISDWLA